jgi:hypothetical protein
VFGIFKSSETKRRERERDVVISAIQQNVAEAQQEILYAEHTLDKNMLNHIANSLRNAVIYCDRTAEAVEARTAKVKSLFDAGESQHAIGEMLGTRLVISAVLLGRLTGKEWMEASLEFALLEGTLRGFLERHKTDPWPVMYMEKFTFERYRTEYIERE